MRKFGCIIPTAIASASNRSLGDVISFQNANSSTHKTREQKEGPETLPRRTSRVRGSSPAPVFCSEYSAKRRLERARRSHAKAVRPKKAELRLAGQPSECTTFTFSSRSRIRDSDTSVQLPI